ncbi:hypothetical protein H2200_005119 [Cladophialophora chaetospira]|uniref:Uncharacterized protein n=1 Tax=Cladophialophora chaetospira TaxID=386627 RepID=A0AA38XBL3_9EURO|nr:hypothetical protein H2200_005119 [Cladophialophora chaetospira]
MTTQPILLEDGLPTISKRAPIVQIQELPLCSPVGEKCEDIAHGIVEVIGKVSDTLDDPSKAVLEGISLKRPYSDGHDTKEHSRPGIRRRWSSSFGSPDVDNDAGDHSFYEKQLLVGLHKTKSVDSPGTLAANTGNGKDKDTPWDATSDDISTPRHSAAPTSLLGPLPSRGWFPPSQILGQALNGPGGIVAPLTPPEDLDSFKWESPSQSQPIEGVRTASNAEQGRSQGQTNDLHRTNSASRPSGIQLPEPTDMASGDSSGSNWLGRACQRLVSSLGDATTQQHIQMVVQALPAKPNSTDMRQVMDKVVEDIQTQYTLPPYITITHAYFQAISMDEVPASPPATPNANHDNDDYFQDQTIFTHAATVPAYHLHTSTSNTVGPRPSSHIIAAPSSIQISILERYIPPTTAQEVKDFFTLSRRSYLFDRLLELSSNNGSLLLIYPTKQGGQTFADRYIGPIIEPFLRQFILLNGLYTQIAVELGQMTAVRGMKTFEEMTSSLAAMCEALSQRGSARGLPSRYDIVHAETAEVVLDRALWKDWYIEQEKPRLRQNLVDYHKSGGRMPSRVGQIEVTAGMLAREVVDGIHQSREPAGNAGLQVGVFVIRRSTVV